MDKAFLGTEADGSPSALYCKYCYANGAFTDPAATVESMMDASVAHMTRVLKIAPDAAKDAARSVIPRLKRWTRV
jgi:hypothetical protein